MKLSPLLLAALTFSSGLFAATGQDEALRAELLAIREADQAVRLEYEAVGLKSGWDSPALQPLAEAMRRADAANLPGVTTILDQRGWIGPALVGADAAETLFLVIQHADPNTQRKYLPMFREAVKRGEANAGHLAMMEDRVAVAEGRPQIYGTQLFSDSVNPTMRLRPIADPLHVDERRAALGLPPMAEYLKHWNLTWDAEAFAAAQARAEAAKP